MFSAILLSLCLSGSAQTLEQMAPGADTISVLVGHQFSRSDAHARVAMLVDYWQRRFHVNLAWSGDRVRVSGTVIGIPFNAFLEVTDATVTCISSDPGFLWRDSARNYVQRKLRKYLNPEYAEP